MEKEVWLCATVCVEREGAARMGVGCALRLRAWAMGLRSCRNQEHGTWAEGAAAQCLRFDGARTGAMEGVVSSRGGESYVRGRKGSEGWGVGSRAALVSWRRVD